MGRCPVRSVFPEALQLLEQKQHLIGFVIHVDAVQTEMMLTMRTDSCLIRSCRSRMRPRDMLSLNSVRHKRSSSHHEVAKALDIVKVVIGVDEGTCQRLVLSRLDHALMHQIVDDSRVIMDGCQQDPLLTGTNMLNRVKDCSKPSQGPFLFGVHSQYPFVFW